MSPHHPALRWLLRNARRWARHDVFLEEKRMRMMRALGLVLVLVLVFVVEVACEWGGYVVHRSRRDDGRNWGV
ncbi:hypothetical protein EYC84_010921 [Monilinia fructicola]|uniref:Uncharacterized protein n=1 Tax=Monilinia fructicola TaxID=38448 RepID=A0A5M9JBE0_MONFR|nr:hypothetical protein EYC84_010921 [Monilinia fructicola]